MTKAGVTTETQGKLKILKQFFSVSPWFIFVVR